VASKGDSEGILYVKNERKTLRITMQDIRYIEGLSNYIIIHLEESQHIVYSSITEMLARLSEQFLRIHKSFVVNKKFVSSFTKEIV